jgi:GNAT superfamily N-acetyltransferase
MKYSPSRPRAPAPRIRAAVLADVPALAALYAQSCSADPSYGALFHELDAADERDALRWFFTRRLTLILSQIAAGSGGAILVAVDDSGVLGGVGVLPPSLAHFSVWAAAAWAAAWLCKFGLFSLLRLLDLDKQYSAGLGAAPDERELVMLAVRAASRGGGVGTALLRAALRGAPPGARLLLGTNTAANARFYERRGWTLSSKCEIAVRGAPRAYTQHVFRALREDALAGAK